MDNTKLKAVFMITERGEKSFWTRVGTGFVNRDGSITLQLEAVPAQGQKLQVRDYTPRDAEDGEPDRERAPLRRPRENGRSEAHP